jgi:hypothetical protein
MQLARIVLYEDLRRDNQLLLGYGCEGPGKEAAGVLAEVVACRNENLNAMPSLDEPESEFILHYRLGDLH